MARSARLKVQGLATCLMAALVIAGCGGGSPKARLDASSSDARDGSDARDLRPDTGETAGETGSDAADSARDAFDSATDRGDTATGGTAGSGAGGTAGSDAGGTGTGGMGTAGSDAGGIGTGGMGTGGMGTGGMGTGGVGTGGMGTGGTGTGGTGTGGMGTGGMGTGGTGTAGMGTGGTETDAGTDVPADSGDGDAPEGTGGSDGGADASDGGCGVGCPATLRPALPPIWLASDVGVQCDSGTMRVTGWANRGANGDVLAPPSGHLGPRCNATTTLGGRPVINFDAPASIDELDGVLRIDLTPLVGDAGYTVFVVERRQSTQEGYFLGTTLLVSGIFCAEDPDGNSHSAYRFGYDDLGLLQSGPYIGTATADCPSPLAPPPFSSSNPQASLDVDVFDPRVGHKTYSNGVLLYSDSDVAPVAAFPNNSSFVGRAFDIVMATRQSRFHGDIAEIVIYAAKLEQTEIDQVSSYLQTRWGLPH